MIDIILPTMWRCPLIEQMLVKYEHSKLVKKIIVIDNDTSKAYKFKNFKKLIYLPQEGNIFVNPAWNLGASLCTNDMLIVNDDILIEELDEMIIKLQKSSYTVIGVNLNSESKEIVPITRFPANSWGSCLFIRKGCYTYIPEQIKIWRGDYMFFEKLNPATLGGYVKTNKSVTVSEKQFTPICKNDVLEYSKIKTKKFNVIVRTSNRPNYFYNCIKSIRKYIPDAQIHVTIDDWKDLDYVKSIAPDCSYYLINKETVKNFCNGIKVERKPMIYNYYLNLVKPFLNGWCMVLDDDDELIDTPKYSKTDNFYIHKVDVGYKVVPSDKNFKKKIELYDVSMIGLVFHSSMMVDFTPQFAGDYQFAHDMSKKCNVVWVDKMLSKTQTRTNRGGRNDL